MLYHNGRRCLIVVKFGNIKLKREHKVLM